MNNPRRYRCPISGNKFDGDVNVCMTYDGSFTEKSPLSVDDIYSIVNREENGEAQCPICGRFIGEFEPHEIYFQRGYAISCVTLPQGEAQFMDELREVG